MEKKKKRNMKTNNAESLDMNKNFDHIYTSVACKQCPVFDVRVIHDIS